MTVAKGPFVTNFLRERDRVTHRPLGKEGQRLLGIMMADSDFEPDTLDVNEDFLICFTEKRSFI